MLFSPDVLPLVHDASAARGTLERLPKWLICIPLVLQWLWLSLRYHSATLPSAANPCITSGGLIGEGKLEYFRGMGPVAQAATARHCAISTARVLPASAITRLLDDAGLAFPLIAKPDLGLCGFGVRRVADLPDLMSYLDRFPPRETVVVQQYLPQEGEAGIFYARDPGADNGRIIGLALRYFPRVTGDGHSTVSELISADARARRLTRSGPHECAVPGNQIPVSGAVVRLATIGSTRVGGLYKDGGYCITRQLTQAIDAIARDMPRFYFGRFDVRFDTLHALRDGTGFTIMEVNGAGSEAIEAWDPEISVVAGFRRIFAKQRRLFAIGNAMRRQGVRTVGLLELARLYRRQHYLIALYPPSN